jgi:hypothetical protein
MSLASAAVAASEDVRAAVRASRTASNARATASSAALSAQQACEKVEFGSMDEARAAQTRASIAQSHAIHAAVVEHEAKTVKRRATLALAHDVKTWNIHRKREMLRSCIEYARSQHEASRRAVDSWSSLRDGFIGTAIPPTTVDRRQTVAPISAPIRSERRQSPQVEPDEVTATIFGSLNDISQNHPSIVAVEHNVLSSAVTNVTISRARSVDIQQPISFLPMADVAPIPEGEEERFSFPDATSEEVTNISVSGSSEIVNVSPECAGQTPPVSAVLNGSVDLNQSAIFSFFPTECPSTELHRSPTTNLNTFSSLDQVDYSKVDTNMSCNFEAETGNFDDDVVGDLIDFRRGFSSKHESAASNMSADDILSESMQSLVEGLMSWGGGFEVEEEHFALPAGMATSIALEGSGAMGQSLT